MKTLILNKEEVKSLLDIEECIDASKQAYKAFNSGAVVQSPTNCIEIPKYHGEMEFKCGYSIPSDIIGIKMAGGFWNNQRDYELPSGLAMIVLYNAKNGVPLCILDGTILTAYRTAAAGAIGSLYLARKESEIIGVIGTGLLAKTQVLFHIKMFNIKTVKVWGIENVDKYIQELSELCPEIEFVGCDKPEDAVMGSDIIICATASKKAIVMNEWVSEGMHINAFGADLEGKQELDAQIFTRAKIVNDNISECINLGDTQHAIKQKLIKVDDIYAEIGEIILGDKNGRESEDEITIFDNIGMSIQDIETAFLVFQKAIDKKVGIQTKLV